MLRPTPSGSFFEVGEGSIKNKAQLLRKNTNIIVQRSTECSRTRGKLGKFKKDGNTVNLQHVRPTTNFLVGYKFRHGGAKDVQRTSGCATTRRLGPQHVATGYRRLRTGLTRLDRNLAQTKIRGDIGHACRINEHLAVG